jgi:hypothetical protein
MEHLSEIFYNTRTSYTGLKPLIKRAEHLNLDDDEIKEWYESQPINQVFRKITKSSNIPFNVKEPGRIAMDLIDMGTFGSKNNGYRWILSCIDMMSRYAWCFPVKRKKPELILVHLKNLPFSSVTCDSGNEFKGVVKKFFKDNDIPIFLANPNAGTKGRTNLIEGFNHNIQRILLKYMKLNGVRWIDVLDDIVENYNTDKDLKKKFENNRELIDPFNSGDYVRIQKMKKTFDKRVRNTDYSDDVYRIIYRDGARYILADKNYNFLDEKYLPRQLLKVIKPDKTLNTDKEFSELKKLKRFNTLQRREGIF